MRKQRVRLTFPELTEERRKEMVKVVRHKAEEGRVAVRNLRRQARHDLEVLEKDGEIGQDDLDRAEKELEKVRVAQLLADAGAIAAQAQVVNGVSLVAHRADGAGAGDVRTLALDVRGRLPQGQPGAVVRDRECKVLNTLALDILDGQIQAIRTVTNPDKLGHVGPVGDAWAVFRETTQA